MKKLITLFLLGTLAGCTMTAPNYTGTVDNFSKLSQESVSPIAAGDFTAEDKKLEKLSVRGSPLQAANGGFSQYLKSAVESELKLANLYKEDANCRINATLLENDIDVSGFSTGETVVSARFSVTKDGKGVYEKVLTEKREYESSFVGAVAIPNGVNSYVPTVQGLIGQLFSDPEFIKAVK